MRQFSKFEHIWGKAVLILALISSFKIIEKSSERQSQASAKPWHQEEENKKKQQSCVEFISLLVLVWPAFGSKTLAL